MIVSIKWNGMCNGTCLFWRCPARNPNNYYGPHGNACDITGEAYFGVQNKCHCPDQRLIALKMQEEVTENGKA